MEMLCQNQGKLHLMFFNPHPPPQPQGSYCSIGENLGDRTYFNWTSLGPLNSYTSFKSIFSIIKIILQSQEQIIATFSWRLVVIQKILFSVFF